MLEHAEVQFGSDRVACGCVVAAKIELRRGTIRGASHADEQPGRRPDTHTLDERSAHFLPPRLRFFSSSSRLNMRATRHQTIRLGITSTAIAATQIQATRSPSSNRMNRRTNLPMGQSPGG